ncbi:MAG: acyloxyacyl hydrolase [Vicinamibacterales bacterium]
MPSPAARRAWLLVLLLSTCPTTVALAQDGTPRPAPAIDLAPGTTELFAQVGAARGVELFHSSPGHNYVVQTLGWGRILSAPHGPGFLRGQFEWAMEATPLFWQYDPSRVYAFAFTPLIWRWNFTPSGRVAPYFEIAGGGIWSSDPLPARTTTANWTAHGGFGLRIALRGRQALLVGYRLHHISNGNRLDYNPGVNANMLYFGWSVLR